MAFHPYPQVIRALFNVLRFGPPRGLTPASACPGIAHPASRLRHATHVARFGLAFAPARFHSLTSPRASNSLAHSTKGTPSPERAGSDALRAHGFRYCFTPLPGCFSPFPHGTGALSVTWEYSGLEGGPPCFGPGFTCPALLGILVSGPHGFAYGALTRCGRPFHAVPLPCGFVTAPRWAAPGRESRNPRAATPCRLHAPGFGLFRFRSPLLAESRLISFPPGT